MFYKLQLKGDGSQNDNNDEVTIRVKLCAPGEDDTFCGAETTGNIPYINDEIINGGTVCILKYILNI